MANFLNSIEIPNGVGFEISPTTLLKIVDETKERNELFDKIWRLYDRIHKKYGIENIVPIFTSIGIQSYENKKILVPSNFYYAFSYAKFFNYSFERINEILGSTLVYFKYNNFDELRKKFIYEIIKDIIKNGINSLKRTNNLEDLKDVSFDYYTSIMEDLKLIDLSDEQKQRLFFELRDKLIRSLNKTKMNLKGIIDDLNKPIKELENVNLNIDKFKLFLTYQYFIFSGSLKNPYNKIMFESSKRIFNSIENKNVSIKELEVILYDSSNKIGYFDEISYSDFIRIMKQAVMDGIFEEKTILNDYSVDDFKGKSIDEVARFVSKEIEKTIEKSTELGSENVDANEMNSKLDELDKKIKSGKLVGKDLLKAKHQLQKLHMVMKEVIPRAIHKGLPPFKGFYVYFYDNGMVAIDKIDYGSRLFVMPVSTYRYILDNKIDRLRKAGRLDSVKAYKHDERTDWLGKAKQAILNSTEYVTEADKKYNEQIDGCNFGYTQEDIDKIKNTIESIEKDVSLTSDEKDKIKKEIEEKAKKKRKKKQKANEIDSELKQSNPKSEEEMTKKDNDELANLESKLDDEFGNDSDFDELYEAEKKYKKNGNRCASVSKFGKDRTIDENGMYHCEMCNTTYSIEQKSRLDYHHFVPISKGGPDTLYNGICLCTECHRIIHYEKERIPISTQGYILSLIEKHIREENPELLDKFIEYKNNFFPYINDLISDERNRLKKQGLPENMIDIIMEEKEELLLSDPKKYVKGFELRYHK